MTSKSAELLNWFGLFAPRATPAPVVAKLAAAVGQAIEEPELASKLAEQGAIPRRMDPAAFGTFVAAETAKFARIIEEGGITPE